MSDAYACVPPVANDVRVQGSCTAGLVQTTPTLVVFSADIPGVDAMSFVFLLGFVTNFGGPEVLAHVIRAVVRIVKGL